MIYHKFSSINYKIITYNKVISHFVNRFFVSLDTASLIFTYTLVPFGAALALSILILEIYNKLKGKDFKKYHIESKITDLENQIREQKDKANFISEQFEVVYDRTNRTNEKLDHIHELIKLLDENIMTNKNKIKSQDYVISPYQQYVSNVNTDQLLPNHDIKSQNQSSLFNKDEEPQNSTIEYILKKLEDNSLTTREIQRVIGRTREHTSRLMKKLYEDKFVDRDMSTKPFKYTITDEGRKLLSKHSASKSHSHSGLQNKESPLNELIEY